VPDVNVSSGYHLGISKTLALYEVLFDTFQMSSMNLSEFIPKSDQAPALYGNVSATEHEVTGLSPPFDYKLENRHFQPRGVMFC
jgi:hypothetical protein